jgi:hypothetical protein
VKQTPRGIDRIWSFQSVGQDPTEGFIVELECRETQGQHKYDNERTFDHDALRPETCSIQTISPTEERIVKAIDRIRQRSTKQTYAIRCPSNSEKKSHEANLFLTPERE